MKPTVTLSYRSELVDQREARGVARRSGLPEDALRLRELHPNELKHARELNIQDAWLEHPIGAGWVCAYRLIAQDGAPVVAEVRVFPADAERPQKGEWSARVLGHRAQAPKGGITAGLLREVTIGEHLRVASLIFDNFERRAPGALLSHAGITTTGGRRRGPKGLPDTLYAEVARDYLAAVAVGSRSPASDVAHRRRTGEGRIRRMLYEARNRKLLTGRGHRRSGGELTDRARAILATVPGTVPAATRNQPKTTHRQPTTKRNPPR